MRSVRQIVIAFAIVVGASGCQTAAGGQDVIQYLPPPGWGVPGVDYVVGNKQDVPGRYSIIEWVRKGDSIQDWDELITTEDWRLDFVRQAEGSVGQYAAKQRRDQESLCAEQTRWNVVSETETDITYEIWFEPCPALADHYRSAGYPVLAKIAEIHSYEVARIFDGRWNRFRLSYAAKGVQPSDQERAKWLDWLKSARIAPQ